GQGDNRPCAAYNIDNDTQAPRVNGQPFLLIQGASNPLYAPGMSNMILCINKSGKSGTSLEDSTLTKELDGYREYTSKVRYHLIPGVW
ncbi:MAG: hypothetical protein OEY50_06510, partial [Nitrospinota bacterium]|nr:hypothetical protein [Nitrospinota bacterium]